MAREVLSNGVINPDKYQADWYADLSNNWNLLNNLIGSAISGSEVDSKIATAIQELMIRTFQIVAELPATGTEGVMYLVLIPNTSKYTAYVWENSAYRELGVIQMTITIDDELSTTSENPAQNKVITNALNNKAPISHTHSASDITSGLSAVATSGSYNDLSNKPTIPSKTSDLTNDSGFITSDNTKIPLAGSNAISGSLIPATDNSIDVGSNTKNIKALYTKGITIDGKTIDTDASYNMTYDGHIVDTIKEQGTGYIRYTNGIQICWGILTWQSACSEPWGVLYITDPISESYAKSFAASPSVSAVSINTGYAGIIESRDGNATRTPTFKLCRPTSINVVEDRTISYIAIGRWK